MLADPVRVSAVAAAREVARPAESGLQRLTSVAGRVLGTRFAFLSLIDAEVEDLLAPAGPGGDELPSALPTSSSVCQHLVALAGRPLLVPDLTADPRLRDLVEVRELGMRSYAGFPVVDRDGAVLGGLCVADDVPRTWTSDDALLLCDLGLAVSDELSALVGIRALEQSRDEERRRAAEQAAMHRVAAAVVRGELPQRVLQQAADELVLLLRAEAALVLRFRPDGGTSVVVTAGPVTSTGRAWSWFGSMLRERLGTLTSFPASEDQPCAAVPVRVGGRVWGALVVVLGEDGSGGRVELLEQHADFLALLLVNAEAQLQLHRLARTDPLTGAANRRVFEERLATELARCARSGGSLLVGLLDVDLFKQVNDEHGHEVGDAVLRALSERVGDLLDESGLLARLGGDEWGLLLPGDADPVATLDGVRTAVAAEPLAGVAVTVTVGGTVVDGRVDGEVTADDALRRADAALYAAKRQGRDGVGLG